jgi:hypothetical protein
MGWEERFASKISPSLFPVMRSLGYALGSVCLAGFIYPGLVGNPVDLPSLATVI